MPSLCKYDDVQLFNYTKDFFEFLKKAISYKEEFKGQWTELTDKDLYYNLSANAYTRLKDVYVSELDNSFSAKVETSYSEYANSLK